MTFGAEPVYDRPSKSDDRNQLSDMKSEGLPIAKSKSLVARDRVHLNRGSGNLQVCADLQLPHLWLGAP